MNPKVSRRKLIFLALAFIVAALVDLFQNRQPTPMKGLETHGDDGAWATIMSQVEPRYLPERWDYEEIMADESLPIGHRRMVAVYFSAADISNGGFDQYFFNGYGALTIPAIDAYEKAGQFRLAQIMRQALKFCVEKKMSPQRKMIIPQGYLDAVEIEGVSLDALETEYFALKNQLPGPEKYMTAYPVRFINWYYEKFPEDFVFPTKP
jgi:hypothetical protein